jgi:uncharacterized protein (DUF427 family)
VASTTSKNGTAVREIEKKIEIEPTARWIRAEFNKQIIGDTKAALLVRDGHRLTYYFPLADINDRWLKPGRVGSDGRSYFDIEVEEKSAESAAWSYSSENAYGALAGYVAFNWRKMDHWYEEEEEVFVHPRDPYHRVDSIQSSRHVKVVIDGITVAESNRPVLLFETGLPTRYYFPQEDVRMDLFEKTRARTQCPYKGDASYWSIVAGDRTYRNIVWGYLEPIQESIKISRLLSFFNEKVDIFVDGELERRPESLWS